VLSMSFFNAPSITELYILSLHDALPIWKGILKILIYVFIKLFIRKFLWRKPSSDLPNLLSDFRKIPFSHFLPLNKNFTHLETGIDRKSTRLNSSHVKISYAVFCLKKKTR